MKKSIVAGSAAIALALALSACGKGATTDNSVVENEVVLNDETPADGNFATDNLAGADDAALGNDGAADLGNGNGALGNAE